MLSLQALTSAGPLATSLDARNLVVSPIAGTPLAKLCEASSSSDDHVWGDQGDRKIMIEHVAESTNRPDPVLNGCAHDVEMKEIVSEVAEAVSRHLAYARTVVAPTVDDLVQRVAGSVEQVMRSDMSQLEVVVWRMPAPMYEPSFVESFQRAVDVKPDQTKAGAHLPADADLSVVTGWMKGGSAALEDSVDAYIAALGSDTLLTIYKEMLTSQSSNADLWALFNDPLLGLDYATVGFLITRKLWDSPPEGVEVSLSAYEAEMVDLRNQCAIRLGYELARVERDEKVGILIRQYTRQSVEVNDSVYRKWIDEGGEHSVLFGNVLSDRPVLTLAEIVQKAAEFKSIWETYCVLQKTTVANKKFSAAKSIMATEFAAVLETTDQVELPLGERPYVLERFNAALTATKEAEVQDLYSWTLRLLCDSRFYKTDAFRILDGINRVKAQSPDVDVKEAAAVATLEYIAYWVSTQFQVAGAIR